MMMINVYNYNFAKLEKKIESARENLKIICSEYKKTLINVKYDLLRFDTWEKIDIFATVNLNII